MKKLKKLLEKSDFEWVKKDLLPLIGLLNVGNKINNGKFGRFFLFPLSKENIVNNLIRLTQNTKEQIVLKLKEFEETFKDYIKLKSKSLTYGKSSQRKHYSVKRKCVDSEDLDFTSEYYELKPEITELSNKTIENLKFDTKEIYTQLIQNTHTFNHLILLALFREIVRKLSYNIYYKLDTTKYYPNKEDLRKILMRAQVDKAFINYCINYIDYKEIYKLLSYNKKYFSIIYSHDFNANTCYRSDNILIIKKVFEELKKLLENYDFIKILNEKYEIIKSQLSCEKNRLPLFEYKDDKLKFLVENDNYAKLLDSNRPFFIENIGQYFKAYEWFKKKSFFQIENNSITIKPEMEEKFKNHYSDMQESEKARIKKNLEDLLKLWNNLDIEINSEVGINRYISNLIPKEKIVEEKKESVQKLIRKGESNVLEFKASIRWDYYQDKMNKELEMVIVKTIASFLNSKGGILLIGVNDDGEIISIEKDLSTLKKKNLDGFQLLIIDLISKYIGKEFANYIKIRFENLNDVEVCVITVKNSPNPVFFKSPDKKEFYIRFGNSTRFLDSEETYKYIEDHWR